MYNPSQEELEFLGFLGMCVQSIKIIYSCKKIFLQITLTLILPLSIVFLFHNGISSLLGAKLILGLDKLRVAREMAFLYDDVLDVLFTKYIEYWVTESVYSTFIVVFSLLSTSTVVYTVACIYFVKQVTYKKVMSFAFQVWNRLMNTFLCNYVILISYNVLSTFVLVLFMAHSTESDAKTTKLLLSTIYVLYFIGFMYISVIWQLASIISVLEDSYGFQAIAKSKELIKGKMGISAAIFLQVNLCLGCIHLLFDRFVVFENSFGVIGKVGFGGVFLVVRSLLYLFGLIVQTVIYFDCKSSPIDKSSLSKYPSIYVGYDATLDSVVIEVEQF